MYKMFAKYELKGDIFPVCKHKINVPFEGLRQIDNELDPLENMGVISKVGYSD